MASSERAYSQSAPAGTRRLKLFGEFSLVSSDGSPIHIAGKRERVLLAYLVLSSGQRERRRKLTAILWGDGTDETLLDNLRTCVWALRKALGDADRTLIVSQDDSIALAQGAFAVDALEFEALAKRSDLQGLESAASLYCGELLEGSEIGSAEFDNWLAAQVTHFQNIAIDVYLRFAEILASAGEKERAIACLQKLLSMDRYHEVAVRRLMTLSVETGRRGVAFEAYRALSDNLAADLSAAPELETRQLFAEISQGNYATAELGNPERAATPIQPIASTTAKAASVGQNETKQSWHSRGAFIIATAAALALVISVFGDFSRETPLPSLVCTEPTSFPQLPELPSIAVLPFENLRVDTTQESFADALTNDIATNLSIISRMFVIDPASTDIYRDRSASDREIGRELGVRYLLRGTIQRSDGRVRVTPNLIDSVTGQIVLSTQYDEDYQDTFALQDALTLAVITALQVQLTEGEQERLSARGTRNLDAWVIAGQALHLLRNFTIQDNTRARDLYERAVELDPNYAGALDGLAWTYILAARFGWSDDPTGDFRIANELAARALELDPERSRSYALNAMLRLTAGEHENAVRSGERAVQLDPNGSEVAAILGLILTYVDDAERARNLILDAMRLSPYYPDWYRYALGRARRMNREYAEAEEVLSCFDNAGALRVMTLAELAQTYVLWEREEDAREVAAEILSVFPAFSSTAWVSSPPFADPTTAESERAVLIAAGLPE